MVTVPIFTNFYFIHGLTHLDNTSFSGILPLNANLADA